jgi:outer membrane lipoprotein SlyB
MENNTSNPLVKIAAVVVIVFAAVGVATMTGLIPTSMSKEDPAKTCPTCGVIESVRLIELKGEGTGAGAVTGGVVGAVVGNQIGSGRGNDLATIAGAAGGAYVGHQTERNMRKYTAFRITVRMHDGSVRTITQRHDPGVSSGDNVRLVNGTVVRA